VEFGKKWWKIQGEVSMDKVCEVSGSWKGKAMNVDRVHVKLKKMLVLRVSMFLWNWETIWKIFAEISVQIE
jgi:hypothetical protein